MYGWIYTRKVNKPASYPNNQPARRKNGEVSGDPSSMHMHVYIHKLINLSSCKVILCESEGHNSNGENLEKAKKKVTNK